MSSKSAYIAEVASLWVSYYEGPFPKYMLIFCLILDEVGNSLLHHRHVRSAPALMFTRMETKFILNTRHRTHHLWLAYQYRWRNLVLLESEETPKVHDLGNPLHAQPVPQHCTVGPLCLHNVPNIWHSAYVWWWLRRLNTNTVSGVSN